ncbi:hypothetical protein K501DRAFT_194151 [Backusella circina FSU 941]|nr:hypothetical protein K501DRAFT_194151 [Backusella circina FSU 941]
MIRARLESVLHLFLLVLIQWISLAVVILNATALYLLRGSNKGMVTMNSSPADYTLLILGSMSFVASTIILVFHLQLYYRITEDQPFLPPRALSASEVILGVISVALWTVASSIILTHSQAGTSPCQFTSSFYTKNHSDVCELFDTTLMLGFAAVGGWILILLATLFILIRSPIPPTAIFTIEAPPQRFSQPLITPIDDAYHQTSRPYYMGHYTNRVIPYPTLPIVDSRYSLHQNMAGPSHLSYREEMNVGNTRTSNVLSEKRPLRIERYSPSYRGSNSNPSFYSSHPSQQLPHSDSQHSIQTESTQDSIFQRIKPISLELPRIQLGLSHMDVSFLNVRDGV